MSDGYTAWYGSFAHAPRSVGIVGWTRAYEDGGTQYHNVLKIEVELEFKITYANSGGNIYGTVAAMQQAYSVDQQSLSLFDQYGNVVWNLDSGSAIWGVIVTKPVSFATVKGAEGVTFLRGTVGLKATYPANYRGLGQYQEFTETVSFRGSGRPLKVERQPAVGPMIKQPVTTQSAYYATQSGTLWSLQANPQPMQPLSNLWLGTVDDQTLEKPNPKAIRGVPYMWGISWKYEYSDAQPILILPNVY